MENIKATSIIFEKKNKGFDTMNTDDDLIWTCQYCGVHNVVWVDLTVSGKQDFYEDCRICCRPNRIIITVDAEDMVYIEARPADE